MILGKLDVVVNWENQALLGYVDKLASLEHLERQVRQDLLATRDPQVRVDQLEWLDFQGWSVGLERAGHLECLEPPERLALWVQPV